MKRLLLSFALTLFFLALGTSSKQQRLRSFLSARFSAVPMIERWMRCGAVEHQDLGTDETLIMLISPPRKEHSMAPYSDRPPHLPKSRRLPGRRVHDVQDKNIIRITPLRMTTTFTLS